MGSEEIVIRDLTVDDSEQICELFAKENDPDHFFIWQDRSPDFFSLYEQWTSEAPNYFGSFLKGELTGIYGYIRYPINWLQDQTPTYLIHDIFVHPNYRRQSHFLRLMDHHLTGVGDGTYHSGFYIALENTPGSLEVSLKEIPQRGLGDSVIPASSVLQELYLTQPPFQLDSSISVQSTRIEEAPDSILEAFSKVSQLRALSLPKTTGDLKTLNNWDSEARCYWVEQDQQMAAGALTYAGHPGRSFRWTGKTSLVLEKVQRNLEISLTRNQKVAAQTVGLCFFEPEQIRVFHELQKTIYNEAYQKKTQVLYYRDQKDGDLPFGSSELFPSERRIFFYLPKDLGRPDLEQAPQTINPWRMESLFL